MNENLKENNEDLFKKAKKLIMRRYQHLEAGENDRNLLRNFRQITIAEDQICSTIPINKNVVIFAILITLGFFIYIPFLPFASNRRKLNLKNYMKLLKIGMFCVITEHSVKVWELFCQSHFTWNQFFPGENVITAILPN